MKLEGNDIRKWNVGKIIDIIVKNDHDELTWL